MTQVILKAEKLKRVLAGEVPVTLVRDASLQVNAGEFVAIVGPSGSGKSSLLYLLGLLDTPTAGEVKLYDAATAACTLEELAALRSSEIGFVFQFHFLLPEFTALENVMLPMRKLGKLTPEAMEQRALELLASMNLKEQAHKLPRQLSGGQSQRVAIARALANNPPLILADEPTGNLDTVSSANVQQILRDLAHQQGKTVIAVTHDMDFAHTADRIITIVDGRVQT